MIDRELFRSAGFRFGAIYALLLAISATALALFLWWATAGLLDRQTEAAINADAQGLAERWADGGLPALVVTIEDRLAQNIDDDAIYLLADPNMKRIAGNLASWPPSVTEAGPWYGLPVLRAGIKSLANVQRYELPGGFHLLIGRDVQVRAQLRALLTDALLWAVIVVLLMATAGALVVRSLFRRTLANVSATAAAIAAGDFAQRVRLTGRGDEFDQVAEVINDMLERIGRLMDGVRQVSNAIAHDLRTPITRARTRLEDAALHAETADDLRAAIDRATLDLDGIVAVFQALLRIAEIEAGSRRSSFARLDLAPLLAEVAELYGALAEDRGIVLKLETPRAVPAYGDKAMIQQAIANLVDNAVKFSPEGGTVRLTASVSTMVFVSISDEGQGIALAEREKATDRFYRGESARSTPGSGLGLSLVLAVANLHGGELRLEDNRPGLRAILALPLPDDESRTTGDQRAAGPLRAWAGPHARARLPSSFRPGSSRPDKKNGAQRRRLSLGGKRHADEAKPSSASPKLGRRSPIQAHGYARRGALGITRHQDIATAPVAEGWKAARTWSNIPNFRPFLSPLRRPFAWIMSSQPAFVSPRRFTIL